MRMRAPSSCVRLTERDAALVKGMLRRGDRQHDIAAWFGVNGGRIGEIASGTAFKTTPEAARLDLPPQGPYVSGRDVAVALKAIAIARKALDDAERLLNAG